MRNQNNDLFNASFFRRIKATDEQLQTDMLDLISSLTRENEDSEEVFTFIGYKKEKCGPTE